MAVEPYQPPAHPPSYPPTTQFPAQPSHDPSGYQGPAREPSGYQGPSYDPSGYQGAGYEPSGYQAQAPSYGPGAYQAGGQPPGYGPGYPPPGYPPASHPSAYPQGPPPPGYLPPGYPPPGYAPQPPRKSNIPLIAVIIAVALLLCGGGATAAVLATRAVADRAKEAVKPITPPAVPTRAPDIPDVPLPTGVPDLPGGTGKTITVVYEVTGDGPAEILYTGRLGEGPKRVSNATLPWRLTVTIDGPAFVSVIAARTESANGTINCRATIDGETASQGTHQGAFAAVSCNKFIYN
jgi:hypothetical protein